MTTSFPHATTPGLRKSCHFCRSRKIRCTGQSICDACQERRIDCVYDVESAKGRPKRDQDTKDGKQATARTRGSRRRGSPGSNRPENPTSPQQSSSQESGGSDRGFHSIGGIRGPKIGDDLDDMFRENFLVSSEVQSNIFQKAVAFGHKQVQLNAQASETREPVSQRISYDGLLSFLMREIIEMVALRFGDLGCETHDGVPRRFYITSLAQDNTKQMFDDTTGDENPLKSYSMHRILQLIDLWFSVHPLSSLLSKTLLLCSLKNNSYDEALLATILADACLVHGNGQDELDKGETLFQHAAKQIQNQPIEARSISTSQALILMGWRELCMGHARRGTCYVGYACRIVSELHRSLNQGVSANQTKLNGVDVRYVDGELIRNIYWVCWATTVWSLMQIDHPFSSLRPEQIPSQFPYLDDSSSVNIRLDLASDNVSTLRAQSRTLQELWPLSQVTSTAAHIYALRPTESDLENGLERVEWQARHIHQLRRLLRFQLELPTLCTKIRYILQDAVKHVEREVANGIPQALVLIVYHTMIIHMLFPQRQSQIGAIAVTPENIDEFCRSANALVEISRLLKSTQLTSLLPSPGLKTTTTTNTFILGLDACSRALHYIHSRGTAETVLAISERKQELFHLAEQMHEISRGDQTLMLPTIRAIKKRLKLVKTVFRSFQESPPPSAISDHYPATRIRSRVNQLSQSSSTSNSGLSRPSSPWPDDFQFTPPMMLHNLSLDMEMFLQGSDPPITNQDGFGPTSLAPISSSISTLDSGTSAISSHEANMIGIEQSQAEFASSVGAPIFGDMNGLPSPGLNLNKKLPESYMNFAQPLFSPHSNDGFQRILDFEPHIEPGTQPDFTFPDIAMGEAEEHGNFVALTFPKPGATDV